MIALEGEADAFTAPIVEEELDRAIDSPADAVVVDLTGVTFVDSTALGVLLAGSERVRARGGRLAIVCTDDHIRNLFAITGIDAVVPLFQSVREAVDSPSDAHGDNGRSRRSVRRARSSAS